MYQQNSKRVPQLPKRLQQDINAVTKVFPKFTNEPDEYLTLISGNIYTIKGTQIKIKISAHRHYPETPPFAHLHLSGKTMHFNPKEWKQPQASLISFIKEIINEVNSVELQYWIFGI